MSPGITGTNCIVHPSLGNLCNADAVSIPSSPLVNDSFIEHRPYYVHLSVTGRCNARCAGCVNSDVTFRNSDRSWLSAANDTNPVRDAKAIIRLLEKIGEKEIVVSFYGGEPLLLPDRIEQVVSCLQSAGHQFQLKYMIYTNGQLLGKLIDHSPKLIPHIWLWSVSIDGTKEQHNRIRVGTNLDTIHHNLAELKSLKAGDLLMWSTIREEQSLLDCFNEFLYLYENGLADLFFWHWVETEQAFSDIHSYATAYERDLRLIMDAFVEWIIKGELLPIIHICELLLYILTAKQRGSSACAVETARNFDIMGGKVHPCADLPPEYAIGYIDDTGEPYINPADLDSLVLYKNDLGCYECGIHAYCGGRCPVQALTGSMFRFRQYCQLMRLHVGIVQEYIPSIIKSLQQNRITLQDIYDRAAFYAQFTDVTP